jgi:hypothetical protein
MTEADQIRALLYSYAANEAANPSPVWPPASHDDQPDQCPECGTTRFDFDPNHDDGISVGPAWLCTGCRWGVRSVPNPLIARPTTGRSDLTAEEIRLCHEATEFDHQCRVCATEDVRPDEAVPGTDF